MLAVGLWNGVLSRRVQQDGRIHISSEDEKKTLMLNSPESLVSGETEN